MIRYNRPKQTFFVNLLSLLVAETVLCSSVSPAYASAMDFLRPRMGKQRDSFKELKTARDGGDRERIREGEGLDVAAEIGWMQFRKLLTQMNHAEIVEQLRSQVKELPLDRLAEAPPVSPEEASWMIREIKAVQNHFLSAYPEDPTRGFYATANSGPNKWGFIGRNWPPEFTRWTRIYVRPTVDHRDPVSVHYLAARAFDRISQRLIDKGIMEHLPNVSLYGGRAILISAVDDWSLTHVSRVLREVLRENPELFRLSRGNFPRRALDTLIFGIPLNEVAMFAEMEPERALSSAWEQMTAYPLFDEIFPGQDPKRFNLRRFDDYLATMLQYTRENPGSFKKFPDRRRYMPALVFSEEASPIRNGVFNGARDGGTRRFEAPLRGAITAIATYP